MSAFLFPTLSPSSSLNSLPFPCFVFALSLWPGAYHYMIDLLGWLCRRDIYSNAKKKNGNKIYCYTLSCNDITLMMIGPDVLHKMKPAWKLWHKWSQRETCVTRMTQRVRKLALCAGGCEFTYIQIHECYPSMEIFDFAGLVVWPSAVY